MWLAAMRGERSDDDGDDCLIILTETNLCTIML